MSINFDIYFCDGNTVIDKDFCVEKDYMNVSSTCINIEFKNYIDIDFEIMNKQIVKLLNNENIIIKNKNSEIILNKKKNIFIFYIREEISIGVDIREIMGETEIKNFYDKLEQEWKKKKKEYQDLGFIFV
jgi:hypothetical protein